MKLKKILKSSLISLAILGMIGGSINMNNVSAKRHYHYSRKSHRTTYKYGYYKHHHFHYYKTGYYRNGKWIKRHATKSNKHAIKHNRYHTYDGKPYFYNYIMYGFSNPTKNQIRKIKRYYKKIDKKSNNNPNSSNHHNSNSTANNLAEMKSQTIKDINNDREQKGVQPLNVTPELTQIANMRAKQELHYQGHVDPTTGYGYADEDGYKLGDNASPSNQKYGENLASTALNIEEIRPNDGTSYYDKNGKEAANDTNDSLMNHDTSSNPSTNWGHRDNILNSGYNNMGVGTSRDNKSGTYYIVEDFD